ncbi:polyribonucleotide nucleotidyltransferase 1 [Oratosquilla oratoria]|uniref:polyribonucleotide nucleotidyltransferase 1 n=1 Tax=Oratosquilla oratoria TaxID=337810 RepID=UPI003F772827
MASARIVRYQRLCEIGRRMSGLRYVLPLKHYSTSIKQDQAQEVRAEFSNGRSIRFRKGELARLADGAVVAQIGDTAVLVTAVSKGRNTVAAGFVPLTVDYRQKYAAAGRIPSNFLRRELAPTEKEILTSRIIDRSLRPMFPEGFINDTQVTCTLLAVDGKYDPDVVSINAASAALAVSDIPWSGPVGAVRVGFIDNEVITNPTRRELSHSTLNMVITASQQNLVVMLEGGGNNVLQQDLMKALKMGVKECQHIIRSIQQLQKEVGKPKREFSNPLEVSEELQEATRSLCEIRLRTIFSDSSHNKLSRDGEVNSVRCDILPKLLQSFPGTDTLLLNEAFNKVTKSVFRSLILDENVRCDGRDVCDVRPIQCEVDLYNPLHGSSTFRRGQTQVQCTVAFDAPQNSPRLDPLLQATGGMKDQNFHLHYSFPSYANNELSRGGAVTRREVGHGALAERALRPLLPSSHPFTILLTSTVMESNGSSSMATVCGGSLALMDAGVNVSAAAAGVAVGLVTRYDDKGQLQQYKTLTDILGIEDYLGDMDFKLAGTKKGITALQADIKVPGIPLKVVMEAIQQATEAKGKIINIMNEVMSAPRQQEKECWPKVETVTVPANKRSRLIGPGGINLRRLESETGVQFSWQDQGSLTLFAPQKSSMDEVREALDELLTESEPVLEFGAIYTATIVEIRQTGVMVTLYDSMHPVLLHNSQLDTRMVQHPSALGLEVNQQIKVKYFGRDPATGQMRLSRRAILATNMAIKNLHKKESQ